MRTIKFLIALGVLLAPAVRAEEPKDAADLLAQVKAQAEAKADTNFVVWQLQENYFRNEHYEGEPIEVEWMSRRLKNSSAAPLPTSQAKPLELGKDSLGFSGEMHLVLRFRKDWDVYTMVRTDNVEMTMLIDYALADETTHRYLFWIRGVQTEVMRPPYEPNGGSTSGGGRK
jgi:hypothetical protein